MLYAFGIGEVPISVAPATTAAGSCTRCAPWEPSREAICAIATRHDSRRARPVRERVAGRGGGRARRRHRRGWHRARAAPAALRHVVAHRADYGRVALLYGSRTPADLLYRRELQQLDRIAVDVTVDSAGGGWRGKVGVVPKLVGGALFDPAKSTALVCGPEIMIHYTVQALLTRGLPAERIHVSMERNMRCGLGHCGHCQLGPTLICLDGPVYRWSEVEPLLAVREL